MVNTIPATFNEGYVNFLKTAVSVHPCGHAFPEPEATAFLGRLGEFNHKQAIPCKKCQFPVLSCAVDVTLREVGVEIEKMKKAAIEAERRKNDSPPPYVEVIKEESKESKVKYPFAPATYEYLYKEDYIGEFYCHDYHCKKENSPISIVKYRYKGSEHSIFIFCKLSCSEKVEKFLNDIGIEIMNKSVIDADTKRIILDGEERNKFHSIWTENNKIEGLDKISGFFS